MLVWVIIFSAIATSWASLGDGVVVHPQGTSTTPAGHVVEIDQQDRWQCWEPDRCRLARAGPG